MNRYLLKGFSRRSKSLYFVTVMITSMILLQGGVASAGDVSLLQAEAEIAKIPARYAVGTDAIGRGDLEEGKDIYRECFTEDVVIETSYFNIPIFGPPVEGPDNWADFVAATLGAYVATQHLIGSINVEVHGSSATMSSYVISTHVLPDGSVMIAKGTYFDDVVRHEGQWKIFHRTIKLISIIPSPF